MNRSWVKEISTQWRERFQYAQSAKEKLKYLKNKAKKTILSLDEIWQQAALTEEFLGVEAAFPLYQAVIKSQSHHASANYAVGRILLERDNEKGIVFIEKAMDSDDHAIISGCELICHFLLNRNRLKEAEFYANKALDRKTLEQWAQKERDHLDQDKDSFIAHELTQVQCQFIVTQLRAYSEIKRAYLVKKVVQYLPENPIYVLGIVRHFTWRFEMGHFSQKLADTLEMPDEFFVVELGLNFKKLRKKMEKINKSLIYINDGKKDES